MQEKSYFGLKLQAVLFGEKIATIGHDNILIPAAYSIEGEIMKRAESSRV